jgi:hypothetical protein
MPALKACVCCLGCALACGSDPGSAQLEAPVAYARPAYSALSETGLYADLGTRELAPGARAFEPNFVLWADGASKERWLQLPEGSQVDSSDMDRWRFPIGTRAWKQFSLDGVPLETRLIERYGPEPDDYWMGAFVWQQDQGDAQFVEQGQTDLLGTQHDAPAQDKCPACHNGEPGRFLGFSALQLALDAAEGAWTLPRLSEEARLTATPEPEARYAPPGDELTAAALGYLHANCGHCHNPRGTSWPDTQMLLRLDVSSPSVEDSGLFRSVVGQALQYYRAAPGTLRVAPGDPESSALIDRMRVRGPREQMPPLATEDVDAEGLELLRRWISALEPTAN